MTHKSGLFSGRCYYIFLFTYVGAPERHNAKVLFHFQHKYKRRLYLPLLLYSSRVESGKTSQNFHCMRSLPTRVCHSAEISANFISPRTSLERSKHHPPPIASHPLRVCPTDTLQDTQPLTKDPPCLSKHSNAQTIAG